MKLDLSQRGRVNLTAVLGILISVFTPVAYAQAVDDSEAAGASDDAGLIVEEVVVTGSRIRRSPADMMAPVGTIGAEQFDERGYITAAQALNDFTSNVPALNQAAGDGSSSGSGQQFPNLFGLGTGRTLTLVDGHRFPTTSVGLGDNQVDANIIPTGLIERIEIVQAGGAAVYGSDAIAGVVNYILKDDFEGMEIDVQYGDAFDGDYAEENYRLTWGTNFDDKRGNIALNVEHASSPRLGFADRDRSNLARITQRNPEDTGPDDGIPSVREIIDAHFWNFNGDGIVYNIPAPPPFALTLVNGAPTQFAPDGSLVPYNPGNILGIPFAEGGDGFRYSELAGLRTGVERTNATLLGHYDLTNNVTVKGQFLYSRTVGDERPQGFARTVLSPAPFNAIPFFNSNPFLSSDAVAALSAANPAFAGGAPLWLSRHFYFDLLPSNAQENTTDVYYGLIGAEGDLDWGTRSIYWTVSASLGRVEGETRAWDVHNANFANAVFAVPDGTGGAACLINVDGDPTNDDPACAPLNPFGFGNISRAATNYVSVMTGQDYKNDQLDMLATAGTTLFSLPGGDVEAVFAYEHRNEDADFIPLLANQLGLTGVGAIEEPQSGGFHTNELSVEVLVPLVNREMDLPLINELEFNGTYRSVANSLAGNEDVWSLGMRWQPTDDVTLRVTQSRNFRAPTLTQLLAPTSVAASSIDEDPCDADRINGGPNPDVRRANCEAEWAANPNRPPLDEFQDPAENFIIAQVTSGGNPDLRNEISDTTTYGIVFQPSFVPGLTLSVDRIEIELEDGLSAFLPADFLATCYDSSPQPSDICSTFTRLDEAEGTNPAGTVITALSTTFNAGIIEYEGEYYYADYRIEDIFRSGGQLAVTLDATHNRLLNTSVTGTTFVRSDNTVQQPDWVGRLNVAYSKGPLLVSYQLFHLSAVKGGPNSTIENSPNPEIASNTTHAISAHYDIGDWTLRGGVINLTDREPSYPTLSHGDILGRRWFVGATARF